MPNSEFLKYGTPTERLRESHFPKGSPGEEYRLREEKRLAQFLRLPPVTPKAKSESEISTGFISFILSELGMKGITPESVTQPRARFLLERLERKWALESQAAKGRFPYVREDWLKGYEVPETERAELREYPWLVAASPYGFTGLGQYSPEEKRVAFEASGVTPDIIAHEMAHANYYEQMPEAFKEAYPYFQRLGEILSPEYKKAVAEYWTRFGDEPPPYTKELRTIEGYPTAYMHLGKSPEKMPFYMEPFYGNLMYPVVGEGLGSWVRGYTAERIAELFPKYPWLAKFIRGGNA